MFIFYVGFSYLLISVIDNLDYFCFVYLVIFVGQSIEYQDWCLVLGK